MKRIIKTVQSSYLHLSNILSSRVEFLSRIIESSFSTRLECLNSTSQFNSTLFQKKFNSTRHFSSRVLDSNLSTRLDAISLERSNSVFSSFARSNLVSHLLERSNSVFSSLTRSNSVFNSLARSNSVSHLLTRSNITSRLLTKSQLILSSFTRNKSHLILSLVWNKKLLVVFFKSFKKNTHQKSSVKILSSLKLLLFLKQINSINLLYNLT